SVLAIAGVVVGLGLSVRTGEPAHDAAGAAAMPDASARPAVDAAPPPRIFDAAPPPRIVDAAPPAIVDATPPPPVLKPARRGPPRAKAVRRNDGLFPPDE